MYFKKDVFKGYLVFKIHFFFVVVTNNILNISNCPNNMVIGFTYTPNSVGLNKVNAQYMLLDIKCDVSSILY